MHPDLSFEQAPPISVPYRFFLTAPWFGVAAGLLLAWQGGAALASRWTPAALAATHLMVVGYMLQAMAGALFQFVPVAAGGNVWRPRHLAALVHPLLIVAALTLVVAFLSARQGLFSAAAALFLSAIGIYVVAVGVALWRTAARGPTVAALRAAVLGLAVTAGLGAALAINIGLGGDWPTAEMVKIHAAWGLGGWSLLLLAGVSYYVVPMFQLTPPYPARLARSLPAAMLLTLALWSVQLPGHAPAWEPPVLAAGFILAGGYGLMTLWLQARRRRKVVDATFLFFRVAMIALLASALSGIVLVTVPAAAERPEGPVWLGVLVIVGVFVSAINGMLYKIVPFINWLQLQRLGGIAPNMREMIPESAMALQLRTHVAALLLLLAAVWWPPLSLAAGLTFALSCGWLGVNLVAAVRRYVVFRARAQGAH